MCVGVCHPMLCLNENLFKNTFPSANRLCFEVAVVVVVRLELLSIHRKMIEADACAIHILVVIMIVVIMILCVNDDLMNVEENTRKMF